VQSGSTNEATTPTTAPSNTAIIKQQQQPTGKTYGPIYGPIGFAQAEEADDALAQSEKQHAIIQALAEKDLTQGVLSDSEEEEEVRQNKKQHWHCKTHYCPSLLQIGAGTYPSMRAALEESK
jgi:hypothetical protein